MPSKMCSDAILYSEIFSHDDFTFLNKDLSYTLLIVVNYFKVFIYLFKRQFYKHKYYKLLCK